MILILKTCKKKHFLFGFSVKFDIEFLEWLNICIFQKPFDSQQSYNNV